MKEATVSSYTTKQMALPGKVGMMQGRKPLQKPAMPSVFIMCFATLHTRQTYTSETIDIGFHNSST